MIEMIHKFHSTFQRLIVVESQIENVYDLTKQCQRIYERDIQIDKSERIVNRIKSQKQRRIRVIEISIFAFVIFASVFFFRQILFESKLRLFNSSSDAIFRLTQKKLQILNKQKRCYKCKKLRHKTSTCENELKFMSTKLKKIVKLFDSKN